MMDKEDTVSDIIEQIPFINGLDILHEDGMPRLVLYSGTPFRWSDLDAPLEEVRKIIGPFNVTVRTKLTQTF